MIYRRGNTPANAVENDAIRIYTGASGLPYGSIMEIYQEDLIASAKTEYSKLPLSKALHEAQQDFYSYLTQDFFSVKGAFMAISQDAAALRIEPVQEGYLLTGLCTAPAFRRQGFAGKLLKHVFSLIPSGCVLYSHVDKANIASVEFHKALGFSVQSDGAKMLDGVYLHNFWTFAYRIKP